MMAFHTAHWPNPDRHATSATIVLIVGRLPMLVNSLVDMFTKADFAVDYAMSTHPNLATHCCQAGLIVLDLESVDPEIVTVVAALRASGVKVPVVAIIAGRPDALAQRLYEAGADSILPAPVDPPELLARCRALVRPTMVPVTMQIGSLLIDCAARTVHVGDRRLDLSLKQYAMLEQLARRARQIATRQLLLDCLYRGIDVPDASVIDFYIHALRRQLAAANSTARIITVRGVGYCLTD